MQDAIGGNDFLVVVPFLQGSNPIIPDVGSVFYTLYDHAGAPITGQTNVPVVTTTVSFQVAVTIPGAANLIASPKKFERRSMIVSLLRQGDPLSFTVYYRLVPLLLHGVTPQDVRSFIGVGANELPDEDIDLPAAYYHVEGDIGDLDLPSLLSTGTLAELGARECIKMRAVINIIPSLRQRLAQQESDGILQFRRAKIDDWDTLVTQAWHRYVEARSVATSTALETLDFVIVTTDSDVITGA